MGKLLWYGAKGGRSISARASDDDLLRPPGDECGPGLWTRANARGCTRAVVYNVPAPCGVSALWTMMYMPFPLYMHCGLWRNRHFHCTCTVVWWCIYLWNLCGWLRRVALTTDVFGKIRLSAVSPRLANAKPLSWSVVVCVDNVRDWMVCGSGFSPGFRTVCQSSASPRTLKVLGAAGVSFPLLGNKQLPHLPDLKYSSPPTSFVLVLSSIFPLLGWFATTAWLRRVQRSPCPADRHTQLAPTAPVCTPPSHSSTVRSFCVRARPTSYRRVLHS